MEIEAVTVVMTEVEIEAVTEVEIEAVTVVMTEVEIEAVTEVEIEAVTEVMTEVATVEVTEGEPQNPAIGVTAAIAEVEIEDKSVVDIAQRLTQIIHLGAVITNHTVRPHSVQYNSFLRSSFFILNE
uniref:Uncharacterized protein n=1 Tax=uncultured marine group II/III euryarchaeote KM3_83_B05 TaxID=1456520 RepID=A0A075HRR0_9EURY|nr:hypothetical protein [uncultured marine group II/III euryarchaeote KM3_83_B05]